MTVTGVDDLIVDGNILYQVITAAASSSDPNYNGLNAANVSVTNQDNDTAGITVNPTVGLITTESGGTATFTVVLTSQPGSSVTIGLSSSDTTEGTVSPTSLTFTSGNWSIEQTATVTGVDDLIVDGNIPYQAITAPASSSDPNYNGLNAANVSVTNQDNDTAGITVNPTVGLITTEAGGTATFEIFLNNQPLADVTIGLTSSDTGEASISPNQLTFSPSDWSIAHVATVTGIDDLLDDGDQSYLIITGFASSTDPAYDSLDVANVSGININDDFAPVATEDNYLTNAKPDQPLIISFPGVLSNDTDANNDPLVAAKMSDPQKGMLDLEINGAFVYTPTQSFTQVDTDLFAYVANDGANDSELTTVQITIDPIIPTINWISPVGNGEIYEVYDQLVQLEANAADNHSMQQVRFFRWDAPMNRYVDIGIVDNSPYQWDLDTRSLNYGWNQIFVTARDGAGNLSLLQFIWIYRNLLPRIFMPIIGG